MENKVQKYSERYIKLKSSKFTPEKHTKMPFFHTKFYFKERFPFFQNNLSSIKMQKWRCYQIMKIYKFAKKIATQSFCPHVKNFFQSCFYFWSTISRNNKSSLFLDASLVTMLTPEIWSRLKAQIILREMEAAWKKLVLKKWKKCWKTSFCEKWCTDGETKHLYEKMVSEC